MSNINKIQSCQTYRLSCKLICIILSVVVLGPGSWSCGKSSLPSGLDPSKLVGQWIRPDGGYVLDLKSLSSDGQIKAAYFNPRAINISKANWQFMDGKLKVFVELRDVNYPGSTYTLEYMPKEDLLKGIYFQAVHRREFEIYFKRKR